MSEHAPHRYFWMLLIGALLFSFGVRLNTHCSEHVSLRTIVLENNPSEDSEYTSTSLPYVFRPGIGSAIRVLLGIAIVAFLFGPSVSGLLATYKARSLSRWAVSSVLLAAPMLLAACLPELYVGEGFRAFAQFTAAVWLLPLLLGSVAVARAAYLSAERVTTATSDSSEEHGAA